MSRKKLPNGVLKEFKKLTGISIPHLSTYASGGRTMSKKRALILAGASVSLGYDLTASDWIFDSEKVNSALMGKVA